MNTIAFTISTSIKPSLSILFALLINIQYVKGRILLQGHVSELDGSNDSNQTENDQDSFQNNTIHKYVAIGIISSVIVIVLIISIGLCCIIRNARLKRDAYLRDMVMDEEDLDYDSEQLMMLDNSHSTKNKHILNT